MREIKFRAKPDKAYFFESDNVPTTDGFVFGMPDTRMLNVPGAEKWRKEHEMVDHPSIVAMTRDGWPSSVVVEEETIGQFTGLHDKNGREIFEGDIVEMMRKPERCSRRVMTRHIVKCWSVCDWVFESLTKEVLGLCMANHSDFDSYKFEVIGNIYDNPDMVKEVSLHLSERKPSKRNGGVNVEFVSGGTKIITKVSQETAMAIIDKMADGSKEG